MFRQFSNLETAFRHVRLFTFVIIAASVTFCCFMAYESYRMVSRTQQRIYILAADGQALKAFSASREDNIPVEARHHILLFHHYFFSLSPDDKVIENNMGRALYLADGSARKQYEDLKESGFYAAVISGNMSQQVSVDSIIVDLEEYPYHFRYYGKQKLVRPTAILMRTLVTEGYLRNVDRSDNNAHGFLIEKWRIIDNRDISTKKR